MSDQTLTSSEPRRPIALWRKVVAAVFDFFFVFFAAGYAIGYLTGNVTDRGFSLNGGPALVLLAAIPIYFIVFGRFLGGTLGQRLLGVR